jgi:UDP-N-acetylglucosamine--N-acetylmuramyl-(pentapeptide) pyrophosphoryl-undecaprenol N-acetylglucosamine transferase
MSTLFVATAGGHLTQLVDIADRLTGDDHGVAIWATNENAQSRSLLAGKNAVFVPEVGTRDLRGAVRSQPVAVRLHREWKFSRVISTGSALAVGYLPYLAARGVRAHYIESATRLTGPSITGRLLSATPGIRLYTQYEHLAKGRWQYAGCVFDRFVATKQTETPTIRRAVVAVGTMDDYAFRRFFDALAPILRPGGLLERTQGSPVETLWQTGCTPIDGLGIDTRPWVPAAELEAELTRADVVISHAGTGSALTTLTAGRLPILIPRDHAQREIGDGHQPLLARELDKRGIAIHREPDTVTVDDLIEAASYRVESSTSPKPFTLQE